MNLRSTSQFLFKQFLALLAVGISCTIFSTHLQAAELPTLLLPAGTPVHIKATQLPPGASNGIQLIDDYPLKLAVSEPVYYQGWVVIDSNYPVAWLHWHSTPYDVSPGVFNIRKIRGSLQMAFDYIQMPAGKLSLNHQSIFITGTQLNPWADFAEHGVMAFTEASVHLHAIRKESDAELQEHSASHDQFITK